MSSYCFIFLLSIFNAFTSITFDKREVKGRSEEPYFENGPSKILKNIPKWPFLAPIRRGFDPFYIAWLFVISIIRFELLGRKSFIRKFQNVIS